MEKKIKSHFLFYFLSVFILSCLVQHFASTGGQKSIYFIDKEINDCMNKKLFDII